MKKIKIYQINKKNCTYHFMASDFLRKNHITINPDDYECVFSKEAEDGSDLSDEQILEDLFSKLNKVQPDGFRGYSLSVSDVISLKRGNKKRCYYIDPIGFEELIGGF